MEDLRQFEKKLRRRGFATVAGVDEAGRGCLAGPLVAGAVAFPAEAELRDVKDSKLLTPQKRSELFEVITGAALAWNVQVVSHSEIDDMGLTRANQLALRQAVLGLGWRADFVLSDAFPMVALDLPHLAIVRGDRISQTIAAASIVAKVTRDRLMLEYDLAYPAYGFAEHKGYGTKQHLEALERYGPCPIHRKCFAPVAEVVFRDTYASKISRSSQRPR